MTASPPITSRSVAPGPRPLRSSSPRPEVASPAELSQRDPTRSESQPLAGPTRAMAMGEAVISSPMRAGSYPITPVRKKGMRKMGPELAVKLNMALALAAAKTRERKRVRSSIGWRILISRATKVAISTTKAPNRPMARGEPQPSCWPRFIPSSRADRARESTAAPARSKRWRCPGWKRSRSTSTASSVPATPMGTRAKNTIRQSITFSSRPPRVGPRLAPRATTVALMPSALPRSVGGNAAAVMAGLMAMVMAAPAPWTARSKINCSMDWARPHSPEATVKMANPATYTGLRPTMSARRPKLRSKEVMVSR